MSCHEAPIVKALSLSIFSTEIYTNHQFDFYSVTSTTLRSPLLKPTKSLFPRVFQAIDVTWWNLSILIFFDCFSSRFFFPSILKLPSPMTGESLASKSQIWYPTSVPMAIQWHLGLKARQLTEAPASWLGAGFSTSEKSKTLTFLSFPPVTMKFPLGETVTALMELSCTLMLSLMLKVWLFQILRYPSHPMEAKYWPPTEVLVEVGMNLTLETQSLWLCSLTVCLQLPLTFQSLISLSAPEERIYLPSLEMAHERISLVWPSSVNLWVVFPVLKSHSLRDLSHEEERR